MVPDLEKMQERGLIDPIIKQEGEVDGDNLILNPDKPRPKLPVLLLLLHRTSILARWSPANPHNNPPISQDKAMH